MSLSSGPDELSEEEIAWSEKWETIIILRESLIDLAEYLIEEGIIVGYSKSTGGSKFLIDSLTNRLDKNVEELKEFAAFHPFIGSTIFFGQLELFDTPEATIENTARLLLKELEEKRIWYEKWDGLKALEAELWTEAKQLMKKGRILCEDQDDPNWSEWGYVILPRIFEKRLGKEREELQTTIAFHPFIGGTMDFDDPYPFDLTGDAIEQCARALLRELQEANASQDTTVIEL